MARLDDTPSGGLRLVVNARFRGRPVTGVERYAAELTARLPHGVRYLAPPRLRRAPAPYGHLWEQAVLPARIGRDELLWNPCNTGPVRLRRQVVTVHDLAPIEHPEWFSSRYGRWLETLTRSVVSRAALVLTVSEFTRSRLVELLGVEPQRVEVVPDAVDHRFAAGRDGLDGGRRRALGIPDGPFFLCLATREPRKNLSMVLGAFAELRRRRPDAALVLAGGRGPQAVFAAGSSALAAGAGVTAVGYVPDDLLPGLYGAAAGLVYLPHYEGFGLPPLEAAAAGTPSLLSDIPPLRELGLPAVWADPLDKDSVVDGMERLLDGAPDVADLAKPVQRYSWDDSAARLVGVFERLGVRFGS